MIQQVLNSYTQFDLKGTPMPIGKGNINSTYLVESRFDKKYVLQKINTAVFSDIRTLIMNHLYIQNHLLEAKFPLQIPKILPNDMGDYYTKGTGNSRWRLLQYCKSERALLPKATHEYTGKAAKAFQTAYAFGLFDAELSNISLDKIEDTIPDFHNTPLRWRTFEAAISKNIARRSTSAQSEIEALVAWKPCFEQVFSLIEGKILPFQIIHNDAKMDNVVFASNMHDPIAVIDWDTVMSGCVLADVGDLIRSVAPNFDENHKDFDALEIDFSAVAAIREGFIRAFLQKSKTKEAELINAYFNLAGPWIIGEQALRFLTDYLQGDLYYKTDYAEQNLVRARNQLQLLKLIQQSEIL